MMVADMDRRTVLCNAWRLARAIALTSGRPARAHLADALREAWRAKRAEAAPIGTVQAIADLAVTVDAVVAAQVGLRPGEAREIRALTVHDVVPAGHITVPVIDQRNAPHLRVGEWAVVDPFERELIHGELYVVQYGRGPAIMQALWRQRGEQAHWWAYCLNRPRDWSEAEAWMREGKALPGADGPYRPGHLEEKLLGRIVGVIPTTGSAVLA